VGHRGQPPLTVAGPRRHRPASLLRPCGHRRHLFSFQKLPLASTITRPGLSSVRSRPAVAEYTNPNRLPLE